MIVVVEEELEEVMKEKIKRARYHNILVVEYKERWKITELVIRSYW